MNNQLKFFLILVLSILLGFGSLFLLITIQNGNMMIFTVLLVVNAIFILLMAQILRKIYIEIRSNIPGNDERTKRNKMNTAGYAYFISFYIWLSLFIFKKHLDPDDLLLIGLFVMALSFPVSYLLFVRKKQHFN